MQNSEHIITSRHYLALCVSAYACGMYMTFISSEVLKMVTFAILVIFAIQFAAVTICRKFILGSRIKYTLLPCILIVFTILGAFRITTFEAAKDLSLRDYSGSKVWLYGTVLTEPQLTSSGFSYNFELKVSKINNDPSVKGKILITTPKVLGKQVKMGDDVCLWCMIQDFKPSEQSGLFNYYTHLRSKNIFVTADAQNINPATFDKSFSALDVLTKAGIEIRASFSDAIDTVFAENINARSVLKGILLGDKTLFSNELYENFSNAGISHIVAVSGLHLVILTSFLTFLLKSIGLRRKACLIFSIPFVIMFASITSFSTSVSRASIMFIITTIATLFSRRYDPVTALFCALGIIITFSPFSILSRNLILSFMATLGILVYSKYIKDSVLSIPIFKVYSKNPVIKLISRLGKTSLTAISLTISSFLGTIYFLGLFFGQFSKVQFLTNLWIVPLVWLVFCLGCLMCVAFVFSPSLVASIFKPPLTILLNSIMATVDYFGSPRFTFSIPPLLTSFSGFILYLGLAFIIYFSLKLIYDNISH